MTHPAYLILRVQNRDMDATMVEPPPNLFSGFTSTSTSPDLEHRSTLTRTEPGPTLTKDEGQVGGFRGTLCLGFGGFKTYLGSF